MQWLEVPGPGPGSKVPRSPLFWHKRSRDQGPAFWKMKKKGPRSAFLRIGKKVQVQGPPIWAGPGDLNVWKNTEKAQKTVKAQKKKLLTSQKFKKPANSAFF
jgi:hypothetical protein